MNLIHRVRTKECMPQPNYTMMERVYLWLEFKWWKLRNVFVKDVEF